jgi:hypothetical protein
MACSAARLCINGAAHPFACMAASWPAKLPTWQLMWSSTVALLDMFHWSRASLESSRQPYIDPLPFPLHASSVRSVGPPVHATGADGHPLCMPPQAPSRWGTAMRDQVVERTVELLAAMGELPTAGKVDLPGILVGIDAKVEELAQRMTAAGSNRHVVLLHGMGGIGKTTLARAVLNRLHDKCPTMPCCFVALDPVMADAQLMDKQRQLLARLAGEAAPPLDSLERGRQQLAEKLRGKRVLVVVDNVWGDQLELLLPEGIGEVLGEGSMVLVTSRDSVAAKDFDGAEVAEAGLLPDVHAMELLCQHAYRCGVAPAAEEGRVKQLVARCGGLPMALEVVGRHLRQCKDRQRFFSDMANALTAAFNKDRAGRRDGERTLFAALQQSWDALEPEEQEALLDVTWFLQGQPWEQVEAHCGYGVLDRLAKFGLVKEQEDAWSGPVATVHDTLVDFGSSACGIGRQPRRMTLRSCSRLLSAGELDQVRRVACHCFLVTPFTLNLGYRTYTIQVASWETQFFDCAGVQWGVAGPVGPRCRCFWPAGAGHGGAANCESSGPVEPQRAQGAPDEGAALERRLVASAAAVGHHGTPAVAADGVRLVPVPQPAGEPRPHCAAGAAAGSHHARCGGRDHAVQVSMHRMCNACCSHRHQHVACRSWWR